MFSDVAQALTDPIGWIMDSLANWLAGLFDLLKIEIAKTILDVSLPTVEDIKSQGVMIGLGSTYGLSTRMMNVVAIAVGLFVILTIRRRHGETISRLVTSMTWIALFAVGLYPVLGLATELLTKLNLGAISTAAGTEVSDASQFVDVVSNIPVLGNSAAKLIVSLVGVIEACFALLNSYAYYYAIIVIVIAYPLLLALRPLHKWLDVLFHAINSLLVICLTTPTIMVIGLMFPFWTRGLPLGGTTVAQAVATIIGGFIAGFVPPYLAWKVFMLSREVFGTVEAGISGAIDVNSMPETNPSEMARSTDEAHGSAFGPFAKTAAVGAATADLPNSRDVLGDLRKITIEAVSVGAAATGHGAVAAGLQAVDTTLDKEHRKEAEKNARV